MLSTYGMKLGAKMLLRGRIKRGLRFLVVPVNYWRTVEYKLVLDSADFQADDCVLDIGSPKLLSLYLAEHVVARVHATDIENYFVSEYEYLRGLEGIPPEKYLLGVADGRELPFDDGAFTKVFAISVIEHIPGDGDSACMREIRRVLAPGGKCLLTVPFAPVGRDEYAKGDDFYWSASSVAGADDSEGKSRGVFYQRRYSEQDLRDRLIAPSGMRLERLAFVGERVLTRSAHEFCEYLPLQLGPIHPLASRLIHTPPTASWSTLKKPLCALVVLRK